MNLLNNSYDALSPFEEKWIEIAVKDSGDEVELNFTDSGAGIPTENQEKLINPFFTTKASGKGTGLGLSICTSIAEAHHGSIAIDTKCKNTRIVVRLPKYQPENALKKSAA